MTTWTQFTAIYNGTKGSVSNAKRSEIRRQAIARYQDRLNGGTATCALCFADLAAELINAEAA